MTQIEIEVDGKKYRVNAEPVEEPKFAVGDRVCGKMTGREATITGAWTDGYCSIHYDIGEDADKIPSGNLTLIQPVPEKTWGVDPNGSYVKGVTRFEVKAGERGGELSIPEGATAIYDHFADTHFCVCFECDAVFSGRVCDKGEKWFMRASDLRLIEPLATPKPKDLQEWATAILFEPDGYVARNPEQSVSRCVQHFGGRLFKRAKAGEWAITLGCVLPKYQIIRSPIGDSFYIATFPASVSTESVEDCFALISPYLDSITA